MNTTLPDDIQPIAEVTTQPEWHPPKIVKIELKRTLFEVGSDIDFGQSGTWTF